MGRIGHFIASDNQDATDPEMLARDRLAHSLMYFSRGMPVVYSGDEQGFTGFGGDKAARKNLDASDTPFYLTTTSSVPTPPTPSKTLTPPT